MTRRNRRWLGVLLTVLLSVTSGALAQQRTAPEDVDWDRVKRIWDTLSAEERSNYDRLAQDLLNSSRRTGGPLKTPGENCSGATYEIGSLPFGDSNTTVGHSDGLALPFFGICAGGGSQFTLTGFGPDLVYKLQTNDDCELSVAMTPTDKDMSLYVIVENLESGNACQFPAIDCVRISDNGGIGVTETVTFTALKNETYYVWVDGYNGSSGAFSLSVVENSATGCSLVPVELQSFTVE